MDCLAGLSSTCYGMDTDALDPEAFSWRQLSFELVLHNLVVPHIPALWFIWTQQLLKQLKHEKIYWLLACSYLRGSLHSLKFGTLTLVCPPFAKILQTVLVDKQK